MGGRVRIVLGIAALLGLAAGLVTLWQAGLLDVLATRAALERLVLDLGPWGPLVILGAEVAQVLLAPAPGQLVGIVAGYLYGPIVGTLLCLAGLVLGSLVAMSLARRLGRPLVERLVGPGALQRIDAQMERHGPVALFLIFLLPFLPDDAACFVAGLTRLRLAELLILATIGRAPGVFVSALIGSQAHNLTGVQIAAIAGASIALAVLMIRYRSALEHGMFRLLDRWPSRRRQAPDC
ncbi:MAG: TVP38/TMEM64 family protein [Anaerolineae bacterium]